MTTALTTPHGHRSLVARLLRTTIRVLDHGLARTGIDFHRLYHPTSVIRAVSHLGGTASIPDAYRESLDRAYRSLRDEAALTPLGAWAMRQTLIRTLANHHRLRILKARHPEVFEQPLTPPLVIVGPPRSGTTLLSRTLAACPDLRGIPTWEIAEPFHLGGLDTRRLRTGLALQYLRLMAPELAIKHTFDLDAPEEEIGLLDTSMWMQTIWRLAHCPSYLDWLMQTDARPAYHTLRDTLLWLQASSPDKRFILKLPNHLGWVDALMDAIPEAMLIATHREPTSIVSSYCSLAASVHGAFSHHPRPHELGHHSLKLWSSYAHRFAALRTREALPVVDVWFDALRDDPVAQVLRVRRHFGLSVPDSLARDLQADLDSQPPHRAVHAHHLEDVGLTAEQVLAAFPQPHQPAERARPASPQDTSG